MLTGILKFWVSHFYVVMVSKFSVHPVGLRLNGIVMSLRELKESWGITKRAIRAYAILMLSGLNLGIIKPKIEAANFEMKPVIFQMLQTVGKSYGLPLEDPTYIISSF